MSQEDPFDGDPPDGLERIDEDSIEGTEVTVYEWTLYRNGNPERSGRCISTEVDGQTVSTIGVGAVGRHNGPFGGNHMGIGTYYSNTFVLSPQDSLELEPRYTMTVHPDDIGGEFVDL